MKPCKWLSEEIEAEVVAQFVQSCHAGLMKVPEQHLEHIVREHQRPNARHVLKFWFLVEENKEIFPIFIHAPICS